MLVLLNYGVLFRRAYEAHSVYNVAYFPSFWYLLTLNPISLPGKWVTLPEGVSGVGLGPTIIAVLIDSGSKTRADTASTLQAIYAARIFLDFIEGALT